MLLADHVYSACATRTEAKRPGVEASTAVRRSIAFLAQIFPVVQPTGVTHKGLWEFHGPPENTLQDLQRFGVENVSVVL
jgi:hypothetical protein